MRGELHDLGCHRDEDGELVCECRPIVIECRPIVIERGEP